MRVVQTNAVATKQINRHKAKYQGPFVFGRTIRGAKRALSATKIFLAKKNTRLAKKNQAIVVTGRSGLRPSALLAN